MPQIKMRFNSSTEEVELVVDDEVALSSGKEEFASWANFYNEKHNPLPAPSLDAPVVKEEVKVEAPVDSAVDNDSKEV